VRVQAPTARGLEHEVAEGGDLAREVLAADERGALLRAHWAKLIGA